MRLMPWLPLHRPRLATPVGDGPQVLLFIYKGVLKSVLDRVFHRKDIEIRYGLKTTTCRTMPARSSGRTSTTSCSPMPGTQCKFTLWARARREGLLRQGDGAAKLTAVYEAWRVEEEHANPVVSS
jgi:hypothetical protein